MSSNRSLRSAMLRIACGALFTSSVLAIGIHLGTSGEDFSDQDQDQDQEGAETIPSASSNANPASLAVSFVHRAESGQVSGSTKSKNQLQNASTSSVSTGGLDNSRSNKALSKEFGGNTLRSIPQESPGAESRGLGNKLVRGPVQLSSRHVASDDSKEQQTPMESSFRHVNRKRWSKSKLGQFTKRRSKDATKVESQGQDLDDLQKGEVGYPGRSSGYGRGVGNGLGPLNSLGAVAEGRFGEELDGESLHGYRTMNHRQSRSVVDTNRWKERMVLTTEDTKSTFSIDVDTASYSNVRSQIERGRLPRIHEVRVEEMINYFDYRYDLPPEGRPVWAHGEVGPCPWNSNHKLVHIGVQAEMSRAEKDLAKNLVFLIDVSGSMSSANRLPLLKRALAQLVATLDASDRISIVVYAGAAGEVLSPTSGSNEKMILAALEKLKSGGSTNGAEGIELAYQLAQSSFIEDGVNRVILATDGDFNVGTTSRDALVDLISQKRETGVYLSVLRFGQSSHSDSTMEQLADRGNGNYAYIDSLQEAHKVLVQQAVATLIPAADDVKIQVDFDPKSVRSYRLVGYENRRLAHQDFSDDTKDAGDIGMGHTVTAIYEIEPQAEARQFSNEKIMSLRLRYKEPGDRESKFIERLIYDREILLGETSEAFRFSAAVAEFGELLGGQRFPDGGFSQVLRLAENARGADYRCYRANFIKLVSLAAVMQGYPELAGRGGLMCSPSEAPPRPRAEHSEEEHRDERDKVETNELLGFLSRVYLLPVRAMVYGIHGLAAGVRCVPLWICILPAMLGGLLLELSNRSSLKWSARRVRDSSPDQDPKT